MGSGDPPAACQLLYESIRILQKWFPTPKRQVIYVTRWAD